MEAWLRNIPDQDLLAELRFPLALMQEDQGLDHFVGRYYWRALFVRGWLDRLVANDGSKSWTKLRPEEYPKYRSDFDRYEEYLQEQREEWELLERKRDEEAAEEADTLRQERKPGPS